MKFSDTPKKITKLEQKYWPDKERTIKEAIEYYYRDILVNLTEKQLPLDHLAEYGCLDIHPDGTEIFRIGDHSLLKFQPASTNIDIEEKEVIVTVQQTVELLYL